MKKKEKILIFLLLSFAGLIANIYLSEFIGNLLLGDKVDIRELSFFDGLKNLFIDSEKLKLFLLLECVKYLGIAFFVTQNKKPFQAELVKITEDIYTPKQVGQYQYGSSRWLTEKEKGELFSYFILDSKDKEISKIIDNGKKEFEEIERNIKLDEIKDDLQEQQDLQNNQNSKKYNKIYEMKNKVKEKKDYAKNMVNQFKDTMLNKISLNKSEVKEEFTKLKKGGIVVGMKKEGDKEKIYYIDEDVHTLVVGATRSGKTRCLVIQSICTIGLSGESMVISDPKGELFNYTSDYLKNLGYEIVCLDYKNPNKSTRYNLLQPVIDAVNNGNIEKAEMYAWDITNILVGDNVSNEKIWENGEKSVLCAGILCVVIDNKDRPQYQNLTNVYWFIAEMNKKIGDKTPIELYIRNLPKNHPARALLSIAEVAPSRTKGSFYTSALTTLKLFTSNSIYSITNTSDCKLEDLGRKKQVIYFILPDEKTTYYQVASLVVSQLYEILVRQADERGGVLKNRVNYILDEFGNFVKISDFTNKLTVAGGRGIRFNLFLQSFEQLDMKYGKEEAHIIKSNCQNWVYLQADDDETLQSICNKLGKYTTSAYQLSSNHAKFNNPSSSHSLSLVSRELLTTDEIRRIKRPYQIVIGRSFPAMMIAEDLSKWNFNTMCGLGNKEHNIKVRIDRENKRKILQISKEIDLWEIWILYKAMLENNQEPSQKQNEKDNKKFNLQGGISLQ